MSRRLPLAIFFVIPLILVANYASATRRSVDEEVHQPRAETQNASEPQRGPGQQGPDCALVPPALWCAGAVREKCGTQELCARYEGATNGRPPLNITVLYESLCPDSQKFINTALFDLYMRFGSRVKIDLVPYGNAHSSFFDRFKCQHGEEECRINKFQSCAIHYIPDPVMFIYCLESLLADKVAFDKASKLCFNYLLPAEYYIQSQILQCANGTEGDALQRADAQKTYTVWPDRHRYVPWIVINGVSLQSKQFWQNALPALICQSLADDDYLLECDLF